MRKKEETNMTPTFFFYKEDLQANGTISPSAISRECDSFEPNITTKLITELKYLHPSKEPISVHVGNKELFRVQFVDNPIDSVSHLKT